MVISSDAPGLLSEKLLPNVVFGRTVGILNIYWLRIHVAPTSASQFTWQLRPTRSDRLLLAEPAGVHQEPERPTPTVFIHGRVGGSASERAAMNREEEAEMVLTPGNRCPINIAS